MLRSPYPHARIVRIDTEAAAMPGVRAVVTHEDVPGDAMHGRPVADRPVFAKDIVRHHGEPIAAVAADHPDTARLAAAAILVEYEVLEPVTDPEKAFAAEPLHPDGNLIRHIPLRFGDPDTVGEVIVEGLYRVGRQDPAPIGAEAGLAVPRPDGGVELYVASTDPHADRDIAAACFGLEADHVKVVVTGVPGAMGDREDSGIQLPLGLLALKTGCPVKFVATREESFLGHAHRHPTLLRYRHHADAEGRLVKVEAQILLDAGAYADASSDALAAAVAFAAGPYVVPHVFVEGWAVRTNNPPSGHVRGEGALQVCTAYEGQMDKLAAKLGLEPAEIRMRNVLATGDLLPTGQTVTCPAPVGELLKAVRDADLPPLPDGDDESQWLLPGGTSGAGEPGAVRRGVGYALGMVHVLGAEGTDEVSTATVRVHDGRATVICAAVETGQGFTTLARQIVQEVLGVEDVRVLPSDTDQPPAGPAARGRHTWVSGGAVERAAKMVRTQLLQPLAREVRHVGGAADHRRREDHLLRRGALDDRRRDAGRQGAVGDRAVPPAPHRPAGRDRPGRRLRRARPSARSARWSTSTSSWARCGWWNWPSPRTSAGSSTRGSSPPVSRPASPRAWGWPSWRTCARPAASSSAPASPATPFRPPSTRPTCGSSSSSRSATWSRRSGPRRSARCPS